MIPCLPHFTEMLGDQQDKMQHGRRKYIHFTYGRNHSVHAKQDITLLRFALKPRSEVQSRRKSSGFRHTGAGSQSQLCHFSEIMATSFSVSALPVDPGWGQP